MAEMEVAGVKLDEKEVPKNEERVISFRLNSELIGIDIKKIIKITKKIDITPVPKTEDFILGVINLRGNIIPVVDLKKILGLPKKDIEQNYILVIDTELGNIGLMIDEIIGANTIETENIQPAPINSIGIDSKYIYGVTMIKDEETEEKSLLILLDVCKLFDLENLED